jgi:maleate isomerase
MEPEFYAMAPFGVSIHTARMMLQDVTPEGLEYMAEDAVNAAELLSTADVDIIVYGCTSGSLVKGEAWESNLVKKIHKATGIPTKTTVRAVVEALKAVRATEITVVTPYIDELNRLEKTFLEAHGFHISNIKGLGLTDNLMIGKVSQDKIRNLIDISSGSDCLFISCTNLPVTKMIQSLESQYKVPVITSNQASMWSALQSLNQEHVDGYGTLLKAINKTTMVG